MRQCIAHFVDEFAIFNERRANRLTGAAGEATIKMSDHVGIRCEPTFRKTECETDAPARAVRFIVRQGKGGAVGDADAAHHAVKRMVLDAHLHG